MQRLGDRLPACVTVVIHQLTEHAEILTLTIESNQPREAEASQNARRGQA